MIRSWPYPYRAALALCGDPDWQGFEAFLEWYRLLAAQGLEAAGSFWMYQAGGEGPQAFSYYEGLGELESPHAGFIRKGIRDGFMDSLHAYGDFNQRGGFHRGLAQRAVSELRRHGLAVPIWTAHGGAHNLQNYRPFGLGDVRRETNGDDTISWPCLEYHADLTEAIGVRYVWSGTRITPFPFRGVPCTLREYARFSGRGVRPYLRGSLRRLQGRTAVPEELAVNALMEPRTLDDGRKVWSFLRTGEHLQDALDDLPRILEPRGLDQLERVGGARILYYHPGKRRHVGPPGSEVLGTLADLAGRFRSGRLLVATTARLLDFHRLVRDLSWEAREEGGEVRIRILGRKDPLFGESAVDEKALQGLAFHVDRPERTRIILVQEGGDRELAARRFPPDHTGRPSLGFPWVPLDASAWLA